MYPALIGAGISQLYDLMQGSNKSASSTDFEVPDASPKTAATSQTGATSPIAVDLRQLLLDLQSAGGSDAADGSGQAAGSTSATLRGRPNQHGAAAYSCAQCLSGDASGGISALA